MDLIWADRDALFEALAQHAGLREESEYDVAPLYGRDLEANLRSCSPAVVDLGDRGQIGILKVRGRKAVVLAPDWKTRRVELNDLLDLICDGGANQEIDALLDACGARGARRKRARRALVCERLYKTSLGSLTLLSRHPGASFVRQLRQAGLIRAFLSFVAAHALESALWLAVWWGAGQAALSGRADSGWMTGWALLIAAIVPARMWATWSQGKFSTGASGFLKQRLLAGTLSLQPGEIAREGAGKFFSRIAEAETLEMLALSGGLMAIVSIVEITLAASVLWMGANGGLLLGLLAVCIAVSAAATWRYAKERSAWTEARLALTDEAVEQMIGHRTRLAQEPPLQRHDAEDQALQQYHRLSAGLDRWGVRVTALIPHGWLIAGMAGLLAAFLGNAAPAELAVSVGGILLAYQALRRISAGAIQVAGAAMSWRSVAPLFRSAGRAAHELPAIRAQQASQPAQTVIDAADLSFRYQEGGRTVFDNLHLQIGRGEWILLEGESGGGKSTLVSILAGLRTPSTGLLISGGLDRRALGEQAWRKRIVAAPQYHENHILTGSLAFNLLMGRTWPPTETDLREAAQVCRELGLGPLLEKMPGGLHQIVGETGWQLSQGERSRIFLARALLQNGEMTILDESFAALDPESLRESMECTLRRAETLLVVAHP